MASNTLPLASCLHDTLKALVTSIKLHAERQGQSNACPCYAMVPFFLDRLHDWLSLPEPQCLGSAIASGWTPCGDPALNAFSAAGGVCAPFALDTSSGGPSPMESDFIFQPFQNTALDPDNVMDVPYPSELDHLAFNPEPLLEFSDGFHPDFNITPMDHASSQIWSPHAPPQSPNTSSSSRSSSYDDAWANERVYNHVEPLSYNIQPHTQNSSLCGAVDFHSPWSEERRSDGTPSVDDMDSTSGPCRWNGGSCSLSLTVDKSEVMKHLQIHHGLKSGGDKDRMPCNWDGCRKEMKKESISRHIVAVHLSNKTECGSCGKQFARLDSKLRHLKNSKREECRESETHDSRAKRRRLSWP